ncbi:hypothetical protein KVR01_009170 [Diaporthe batatas]|uniref:uncharacterized protein n=1 Tax=Diaporthe batatas TaxID=748121 RepID=UPI001D04E3E0|nr:uncharacterized protein KVR01_009170 [Diaporthe batatas]KAG8160906.1 hypothetical protein KVR01_009170 [Diaporthe batatas]
MAPVQSVEIGSDADLQVMQEEALSSHVSEWLQHLRAKGKSLRPEDSRRLRTQFIDEMLDDIFEILPQPLRESEAELDARVSYLIHDFLKMEAEAKVEVDASRPPHRQVWDAMLAKARLHRSGAKEYRYQSFIDNQGSEKLFALLEKCADDFVWKNCVVDGKAIDPEFLHSMKEDYRHQRSGWYLIFMWDDERQVWEWYRVYVGQAGGGDNSTRTILVRANEHRRNAKNIDCTQLVYRAWRAFEDEVDEVDEDKMNNAKILKLGFAPDEGVFPESGDDSLFLNIGEMYFSLIFRGLQVHDLIKWLPEGTVADSSELAPVGLNVALPLAQGNGLGSRMAFGKLANSPDPQVREYVRGILRQNLQKVVDDNFKSITNAMRKNAAWANENIFRDGPAGQTVEVKCGSCDWVKEDDTPRYLVRTGQYLSRPSGCANCPLSQADKKAKRSTAKKTFFPTDDNLSSERVSLIYRRLGKDGWPEYYKGVRARAPLNRRGE